MTKPLLISMFLSFIPISELRGGIPFGFFSDIPLSIASPLCIASNMLVPIIAHLFLATLHTVLYRRERYKAWFDKVVVRTQKRISPKINKYGYLGLMLFVAIPLPLTGAWTGSLGSWVFGMEKKKAIFSIMLGVLVAGIIVTLILLGGLGINSIFIKRI